MPRRSQSLRIRLSDAEQTNLKTLADAHNMSISNLIRWLISKATSKQGGKADA